MSRQSGFIGSKFLIYTDRQGKSLCLALLFNQEKNSSSKCLKRRYSVLDTTFPTLIEWLEYGDGEGYDPEGI
jgi:hypothetical protein